MRPDSFDAWRFLERYGPEESLRELGIEPNVSVEEQKREPTEVEERAELERERKKILHKRKAKLREELLKVRRGRGVVSAHDEEEEEDDVLEGGIDQSLVWNPSSVRFKRPST